MIRGQASGEPVPFGRTKSDPQRIGVIERDRHEPVADALGDGAGGIAELEGFLGRVNADQWGIRGLHPKLGPMTIDQFVEMFLVGHLEEHAEQLEAMRAASI